MAINCHNFRVDRILGHTRRYSLARFLVLLATTPQFGGRNLHIWTDPHHIVAENYCKIQPLLFANSHYLYTCYLNISQHDWEIYGKSSSTHSTVNLKPYSGNSLSISPDYWVNVQ